MSMATSGSSNSASALVAQPTRIHINVETRVRCCCVRQGVASTGKLWGYGLVGGSAHRTTAEGRLQFNAVLSGIHVWECIGRSVVLSPQLDHAVPLGRVPMVLPPPRVGEGLRDGHQAEAVAAVVGRSVGAGPNHEMLTELLQEASAMIKLCQSRQRLAFAFAFATGAHMSSTSLSYDLGELVCTSLLPPSYDDVAIAAAGNTATQATQRSNPSQGQMERWREDGWSIR